MTIHILAINNIGKGLSGGDTIWINLAKYWKKKDTVNLIGCWEAIKTMGEQGVKVSKTYEVAPRLNIFGKPIDRVFLKKTIAYNAIYKLFYGVKWVLFNRKSFKDGDIVYSASDFFPDFVPALLIKWSNPQIKWVAGFYLFAPSPWSDVSPYRYDSCRGILYWLSQRISYPLIKKYADVVFVTSDIDKDKFPKTVVVKGGV